MSEEKYAHRFNQGYLLTKYAPEIADLIPFAKSKSEDIEALLDGRTKYIDDRLEDITPPWLARDPELNKPEPESPSRDIDDIEPELD